MASSVTPAQAFLIKAKKHHLAQKSGKKSRPIIYTCELFNAFFGYDASRMSKKIGRRAMRFMGINLLRIKDHELALFPDAIKLTVAEIPDCEGPYSKSEIQAAISELHETLPLEP